MPGDGNPAVWNLERIVGSPFVGPKGIGGVTFRNTTNGSVKNSKALGSEVPAINFGISLELLGIPWHSRRCTQCRNRSAARHRMIGVPIAKAGSCRVELPCGVDQEDPRTIWAFLEMGDTPK